MSGIRLHQLILLSLVVLGQFACAALFHSLTLAMLGLITLFFVGVVIVARALFQQHAVHTLIVWVASALVVGGGLLVAVTPRAWMVVVIYPLIIVVSLVPFVSRRMLRLIIVGALLILAAFASPLLLPIRFGESWLIDLQLFFNLIAISSLGLLLTWQSHGRISTVLSQLRAANYALTQTRTGLESQVVARTEKLNQTITLLRATLEATADGILVVDSTGAIITCNSTFLEMWRIPDTVMADRDDTELLQCMLDQLLDPVAFLAQIQALQHTPDEASADMIQFVDGRVFERQSLPQRIEGRCVGRVWSFRDVTQRTRAETSTAALMALGQQLNTAVTVHDAGQIITTVADQLLHWDSCFLNLCNPDGETMTTILDIDIIDGRRVETPTHEDRLPISPMCRKVIAEGAQIVLRGIDPDPVSLRMYGNYSMPSASMLFVPICNGPDVVGIVSIQSYTPNAYTYEDLQTLQFLADHCAGALERIRTEEALRHTEEERQRLERGMLETQKRESLGVLAGGVAHDFNNLLAVVQGNIDLARLDLDLGHPAMESLHQIERATRRAADLTRQMLAYTGKGVQVIESIAVNEAMMEMSDLLSASLPKHVRFSYDLGEHLPEITGDATQLRQVIMNLLVNAAEAIGDDEGSVFVRTAVTTIEPGELASVAVGGDVPPGMYLAIEVKDTGCGMDAATQAKIFEPFFSTKFTGRGLGLAAVLGIVRSHHGAIRVSSAPGAGTTFQVLLPPATQPSAESGAAATGPAEEWHASGRVLIVDDELSVRNVVGRMLECFGFTSVMASNGSEGVELLRAHGETLAAVLLDLTMPGMSGQRTVQEMHSLYPTMPILLMSGYTEQDARTMLADAQVMGFLHKPFLFDDLREALQGMLGERAVAG